MYRIRKDRLEELKEGKTTVHLASLIGYTRPYLTYAFKGTLFVTDYMAEKIIRGIAQESIRINKMVQEANDIHEVIEYFFEKQEEESKESEGK